MITPHQYFETSIQEDVIDSLGMMERFSKEIQDNSQAWKWLIITTHSTLHGLMVLTLNKGNELLAMRDYVREEWSKVLEHNRNCTDRKDELPYPVPKLDSFGNLYKKIKMHRLEGDNSFNEAIKFLHDEVRNNFVHFVNDGWSIHIPALVQTCLEITELIRELALHPQGYQWYEENEPANLKGFLEGAEMNLRAYQVNMLKESSVTYAIDCREL